MRFKKVLSIAVAVVATLWAVHAGATCSNYTSYSDGQVLTSSSLNSLQTNFTNCTNNVLNGDSFTGTMNWHSGSDIVMYSDAGGTKTFEVDGAGGSIVQMSAFQDGLQIGETSNCGLTLAAGVLSLTDEQGGALAAANPCCVGVPDITAGLNETVCFTAAQTMIDDAGASNLTDLGFGITEAVAWANDRPFFIGVINEDDTGANAGVFITLDPTMTMTPAAGSIHDSAAAAATDGQGSIYWWGADDAGKAAKPAVIIGAIRMQWSTATDDWTIQTLGAAQDTTSNTDLDGIGSLYIDRMTSQVFSMPLNQFGAVDDGPFFCTGAVDGNTDVPEWATPASILYTYVLSKQGRVDVVFGTDAAGNATAGDLHQLLKLRLPYSLNTAAYTNTTVPTVPIGSMTDGGAYFMLMAQFDNRYPTEVYFARDEKSDAVYADDIAAAADDLSGQFSYQAF